MTNIFDMKSIRALNYSTTNMTTVTLSALIYDFGTSKVNGYILPSNVVPCQTFKELYKNYFYVKASSVCGTVENPIDSYIPLEYLKQETVTLVHKIRLDLTPPILSTPMLIITCKLQNEELLVQFNQTYIIELIKEGLVYIGPKTIVEVQW